MTERPELPSTDHHLTPEEYIKISNFIEGKLEKEYMTFFEMRWMKIVSHLEHEEKKKS